MINRSSMCIVVLALVGLTAAGIAGAASAVKVGTVAFGPLGSTILVDGSGRPLST